MKISLLLPVVLATTLTVGCSSSSNSASTSLAQSLASNGFPTLQAAIDAAGLTQTLSTGGDFTVLAPTEAAFAALPAGTLDFLLEPANQATLRTILEYHVIPGIADSSVVSGLSSAQTVQGDLVLIDSVSGGLRINEAAIEDVDIIASNGVIHSIDTVLMPPMDMLGTLQARGFNTLLTALDAAGLQPTFAGTDNYTVLAPTDAAFANLPAGVLADLLLPANLSTLQDILTYHVVAGSVTASVAVGAESPKALNDVTLLFGDSMAGATVNEVSISVTNIPCTNGVIHVIDAVLLPAGDIPTVATDAGFSILAQALAAAGLVDDLQAAGPFTVFAPTDAAFGALPAGVLDDLLLPANQADLISVLLYHVVADELTAQEVLGSTTLTTLQGADLMVSASLGQVGGADISGTNVLARNGIIHVIDSVLIPPGFIPLTMEGSDPLALGTIADASELENEAQWGDVLSPLWGGAFGSQLITFGEFDANVGNPLRPIQGEGAVLRTDGLAVSSKSSGSLTNALAGDMRVSFDWSVLPANVQLDVLFEGGADAKGSLVLAFEDGSREVLEADSNRVRGGFSVSDWRLDRAGQALIGADLLLNRPSGASGIRGIRIHTSDF